MKDRTSRGEAARERAERDKNRPASNVPCRRGGWRVERGVGVVINTRYFRFPGSGQTGGSLLA